MKTRQIFLHTVAFLLLTAVVASGEGMGDMMNDSEAPLLDGMGDYHFKITTTDTLAQRFFDQGMVLAYGFNHREAGRSFRKVAELDPNCAIAYWGQAYVLGTNVNLPMPAEHNEPAYEAITKAVSLIDHASPKEKALIQAMQARYAENPPEDRADLDQAYTDAMRKVAKMYPDDVDILSMTAEAIMDQHPWDYWLKDGTPRPWAPEILQLLEKGISINPDHIGLTHFYIHATEASQSPDRAVDAADRLRTLAPGAGHLVHMPSHTYIRVGQYHKGTIANEKAVQADNSYVAQCRQQDIYPLAYVPHNYHFLWATATLEGAGAKAMKAAVEMSHYVDTTTMRGHGLGTLQHYWITPLYAAVRFGRWDDIMSWPQPASDLRYPNGVWHYARGCALAAAGKFKEAKVELDSLRVIAQDTALLSVTIWDINGTSDLMKIASKVLAGTIAAGQKDYQAAIDFLTEAVAMEDALRYDEPRSWHQPVRQVLGAVLLKAGKAAEAETVYREDLKQLRDNGWSLCGLKLSLEAQGKKQEAATVQQQFDSAWQYADVKLSSSAVM